MTLLQRNARMTNAAIAREVGLTPPATLERTRRLEADGIIRGYHADLNPEAVGYGMTVVLLIRLNSHGRQALDAFREAIQQADEVVECLYLTGSSDFLLKVRVTDVGGYRDLLETTVSELPGLARVESMVVLETYKDERSLDLAADADG